MASVKRGGILGPCVTVPTVSPLPICTPHAHAHIKLLLFHCRLQSSSNSQMVVRPHINGIALAALTITISHYAWCGDRRHKRTTESQSLSMYSDIRQIDKISNVSPTHTVILVNNAECRISGSECVYSTIYVLVHICTVRPLAAGNNREETHTGQIDKHSNKIIKQNK